MTSIVLIILGAVLIILGFLGAIRTRSIKWAEMGCFAIMACSSRDNYWDCDFSNRFYEVINLKVSIQLLI